MELHDRIVMVNSKDDLADFIVALKSDLRTNPETWENPSLERFLEAMESWVRAMDMYYRNTGQTIPETPSWRVFADILYAAKIYE